MVGMLRVLDLDGRVGVYNRAGLFCRGWGN